MANGDAQSPTVMVWIGNNIGWGKVVTTVFITLSFALAWYSGINDMVIKVREMEPVVIQIRKDLDAMMVDMKQMQTQITSASDRYNEIRSHLDKTLESAQQTKDAFVQADNLAAQTMAKITEHLSGIDAQLQGINNRIPPWQFTPPSPGPRK